MINKIDIHALLMEWADRAQKYLDEAKEIDAIRVDYPISKRLLARAETLTNCVKELDILLTR